MALLPHVGPIVSDYSSMLLGEFRRTIDERHRLALPAELLERWPDTGDECILAKERPGALSLWDAERWQLRMQSGLQLLHAKIQTGRLDARIEDVQVLGRLLSTRHREVTLSGRGRLLIPEGCREFLGVDPGGEVMVIGAAVCIEIWRPDAWICYLEQAIPEFPRLFETLAS